MAFIIDLIGLVNVFDRGNGKKLLLVPDGRRPEPGLNIPPHIARIVVLEAQMLPGQNHGWTEEKNPALKRLGIKSFPLTEPVTISISAFDDGGAGALDTSGWDDLVPLLRVIDPNIHIDPDEANTIAQIPATNGKLDAFFFADDSVVGRLTVPHDDLVTITATAKDGTSKTLTLLDGAEIVLANLSSAGSTLPNPAADPDPHFRIYGQLDRDRNSTGLATEPARDPRLQHIPTGHSYLAFIRTRGGAFPSPGCSATGCCPG